MEPVRWPYLTSKIMPINGKIKQRLEDFCVYEIPAYEPCGKGDHVYFEIEKMGIPTNRAVRDIANALSIKPGQIGLAGMKDAKAITRQMLSIEHINPAKIEALHVDNIKILRVKYHKNKLKTGHLKGNRFSIKIRDVDKSRTDDISAIMSLLTSKGVPNYYGSQRFGSRGDTWKIGRLLLKEDFNEAASIICGQPNALDSETTALARKLFDKKDFAAASKAWPIGFGENAMLCKAMMQWPNNPKKAIMRQNKRTLSLYISAFQSYMFNKTVAHRVGSLNQMQLGDLAWKHDKGVVFSVEDLNSENKRSEAGEISPSGPMFGAKMKLPQYDVWDFEQKLLKEQDVTIADLPKSGSLRCTGGRRPLRFFLKNLLISEDDDQYGEYLKIAFDLESGCYATVVLREIFKEGLVE